MAKGIHLARLQDWEERSRRLVTFHEHAYHCPNCTPECERFDREHLLLFEANRAGVTFYIGGSNFCDKGRIAIIALGQAYHQVFANLLVLPERARP